MSGLVVIIIGAFIVCLLCGLPVVIAMAAGAIIPSFVGMAGRNQFFCVDKKYFWQCGKYNVNCDSLVYSCRQYYERRSNCKKVI